MTERLINLTDESWSGVDPVPVGVLLGPVSGIVGAVVGFYFSERQRRGQ